MRSVRIRDSSFCSVIGEMHSLSDRSLMDIR